MSRIYETMFLIDNDAVRASWQKAKSTVVDLVGKHGGKVHTARRWGERRLAYPIRRRHRATYLMTYLELDQEEIPPMRRDLEINEVVLRHLMLRADSIPEEEVKLSEAEQTDDFAVPEPPADDAVDEVEVAGEDEGGRPSRDAAPKADAEKPAAAEAPKAEEATKAETAETETAPEAAEPEKASEVTEPEKAPEAVEPETTPETVEEPAASEQVEETPAEEAEGTKED